MGLRAGEMGWVPLTQLLSLEVNWQGALGLHSRGPLVLGLNCAGFHGKKQPLTMAVGLSPSLPARRAFKENQGHGRIS